MWLYTKWWKWLSVLLLFYVVVGSFMVRLGPGISKVEPSAFSTDSLYTFTITGYHTHFKDPKAGKVQVWFKNSNDYYRPSVDWKTKDKSPVRVLNDQTLETEFGINFFDQKKLKDSNFDVVVNDDMDGTFALREGVTFIKNSTTKYDTGASMYYQYGPDSNSRVYKSRVYQPVTQIDTPEVKHNKQQFLAFPYREILYETIRNTFFHVPMWFVMTALVFFSLVSSVRYLSTGDMRMDIYAHQSIVVALLFGILGLLTGMMWANYTWGRPWVNDPKLNGAAIGVLIYFAYIVLRGSITDEIKRARISAAYNIFALVVFMIFIFIMPRLTDSLHPGNGGNPAFSKYDLDSTLRMFFYPAVIGWMLLGFWILSILIRMQLIQQKQES